MHTLLPVILVLSLGVLALTCKKTPTEPPNGGPDTTSHAFTFVLDTLGEGNSSVLNGVAIISETNVWIVGELYYRDSLGGFSQPMFNAARWNGSSWDLKRIQVRDYGGVVGIFPLKAVFAFSANDVWFASDADLTQWDGTAFRPKAFFMTGIPFDGQVTCMWGTSGTNLYCAGRTGSIYHFNGSAWTKLTSGTTVDIQDIYGAVDARTGETEILAVASLQNFGQGFDLLKINGSTVIRLDTAGLRRSQSSVWFAPGTRYYVVGDGLFWKDDLNAARWEIDSAQPNYFKRRVRGNTAQDVFVVGDFGLASHFNGSTWRHYTGVEFPQFFGSLVSVAMKEDQVVAVGEISDLAIALRGRRTH